MSSFSKRTPGLGKEDMTPSGCMYCAGWFSSPQAWDAQQWLESNTNLLPHSLPYPPLWLAVFLCPDASYPMGMCGLHLFRVYSPLRAFRLGSVLLLGTLFSEHTQWNCSNRPVLSDYCPYWFWPCLLSLLCTLSHSVWWITTGWGPGPLQPHSTTC